MANYTIIPHAHADATLITSLLDIWESSVRATHTFLTAADIVQLRPIVREGLESLTLYTAQTQEDRSIAFAGVSGDTLEMLFVHADALRKGAGSALLQYVLRMGVTRVDVNEQNPDALAFYQHMGFGIAGRSEHDGQGNPFPLLHLRLINSQ